MGRLSSLLIGTITGASAAYFLTTKKGKELTNKVKGFVKEYQEHPQDVHESVKQTAVDFSKQATDAIQKVEKGEITKETVMETVKDKTQEVVDFSQDAIQTIKDKIQQKTGSQVAPLLSKSELESEEIVLDLEDKPVASEVVKTTVEDDVEAE